MEDAIVIAAEVAPGTGVLANEPVTTATLRTVTGDRERLVRIVGGPTTDGGFARLAGHVVPVLGARVPFDLREHLRPRSLPLPGQHWVRNTPPGTWDASKLPLTFILASPTSSDLGDATESELDVAARTWGRPACTGFRARFGGVQPTLSGDDGRNGVFFHDDTWPEALEPGALAQTILHEDGAGKLRDTDIHVNGAEFRWSTDGAPGTQDLRGVLVHEIGHALGLGHSTDARATMNISGSGLRWRSLEQDDIDGVCTLYPGAGSAGCDADPCPAGMSCVAGACQRRGDRADVCAPCAPELGACEAAGDGARCIDIGSGETAGRVCGRSCVRDADCGAGFACRPTSEAGDLQCVSLMDCRNGASPCRVDADCKQAGAVCRGAVCVGPREDVRHDAGLPDGAHDETASPRGGGSSCRAVGSRGPSSAVGWPLLAVVVGALRRVLRRGRHVE